MAIQLQGNGTSTFSNNITSSTGDLTLGDGNLVVADGHGIDFSASGNLAGMTSELLDDYEEGTWTPSAATGTVRSVGANYVKIGGYVHVAGYVEFNDISTAGADVIVNNLPFVVGLRGIGSAFAGYLDSGKVPNATYANPSTTNMYFYISGNGGVNYAALEHDEISSTSNQFFFSIGYRVN